MLVTFKTEPAEYSDPLRDEGFKRLLEEESSSPCKETGWELFSKTLDCEVWRQASTQYKAGVVKGLLTFRGIPPSTVRDILVHMEVWNVFDPKAPVVDVVENHTHYKMIYWHAKLPFCVKPREMLHKIYCQDEKDTLAQYILYLDTEHHFKPHNDSVIRMKTHFLGVIIRPHVVFPDSTTLILVMQVDIKGWLPYVLGNRHLAKAPKNWHSLLTDYYWNFYSKNKISDEKTVANSIVTDSEDANDADTEGSGGIRALSGLEVKTVLNQSDLAEIRKAVLNFPEKNRLIVEKICNEISELTRELEVLQGREEVNGIGVKYHSEAIKMKLQELDKELQSAMTTMVLENFMNPLASLNLLLQAALDTDQPESEKLYHAKSEAFEECANKMAYTATTVAACKSWMNAELDSKAMQELCHSAKQVKELAKQTLCASRLVFTNPGNQEAKESFQALKEAYQDKVETLTAMVDIAVPRVKLLRLAENMVKTELGIAIKRTRSGDKAEEVFCSVACVANVAKRVAAVIRIEASTCQDESYRVTLALNIAYFNEAIASMLILAHDAIIQTNNDELQEEFEASTCMLVIAIQKLFEIIERHYYIADTESEDEPFIEEVPSCPIEVAALQLEHDANQWECKSNGMVEAATKMAHSMMRMGRHTRNEENSRSKNEIIKQSRKIAAESENVAEMALKLAEVCTNAALRKALEEVVGKLKMISTQLKIITSVKDSETPGPGKDEIAIEMLTENAENLMSTVSEALFISEIATIRVPIEERNNLSLKWVKTLPNT